jgi:hypothetical protein
MDRLSLTRQASVLLQHGCPVISPTRIPIASPLWRPTFTEQSQRLSSAVLQINFNPVRRAIGPVQAQDKGPILTGVEDILPVKMPVVVYPELPYAFAVRTNLAYCQFAWRYRFQAKLQVIARVLGIGETIVNGLQLELFCSH